jgi:hypothetical protein
MTVEMPTAEKPYAVVEADCRDALAGLPDGCVDAVVTDPPYHLPGGFMGASWDKAGVAFDPATWRAVLRVLKPSGYLLAFGGTRTYHRLTCAVEDAGFEIHDCVMWLHGQGFPKAKSCLKPAWEPIVLARKPGPRVGPLNIDGCRVPAANGEPNARASKGALGGYGFAPEHGERGGWDGAAGRWPANVVHDGSPEVLAAFAAFGEKASGSRKAGDYQPLGFYGNAIADRPDGMERRMPELSGDTGTAARFFYCCKASKADRGEGNTHPTVKPLELMKFLVRLVTAPGDLVLDPFAGSGSTGRASLVEGRRCVLVELDPAYCDIARRRLAAAWAEPVADARGVVQGNLFAGAGP